MSPREKLFGESLETDGGIASSFAITTQTRLESSINVSES